MSASLSPLRVADKLASPAILSTIYLGIFVNLIMLVIPIYAMQVYDRVLTSRNTTTLVLLTVLSLALLTVSAILDYARTSILQRAGVRFDEALARPLLTAAMHSEATRRQGSGAVALRDAETVREFISGGLIAALYDIPWTPIFILFCCVLHPVLGAVALGGTVIIAAFAFLTDRITRSPLDEANRSAVNVSRLTAALLRNSGVIRGLGMQEAVLTRWRLGQVERFSAQITAGDRNGALLAATKFVRMAIQIGLLCTGASLAISGAIAPGAMIAASILMSRALAPVEQAVAQWKRISGFWEAHARLGKFFDVTPTQSDALILPEPKGHLTVDGLVVLPPGAAVPSVRGISFSLRAGEALAVIGASTSGKSSLARALTGIWPAARGTVRIDGASLDQWDPTQIGRATGYLPQEIELFDGTVAENIARLDEVADAEVTAAAIAAGAHDAILRLPQGYQTRVGDGGLGLSGGMRQRIGLARALYGAPRLVVLDEPNSNLDTAGERALAEALARLKASGVTVVAVTHRPQLLRWVDKVMVMAEGQAQSFGPRDEVLALLQNPNARAVAPRGQAEPLQKPIRRQSAA